ncbi:lysine-specific demethylase 4C [Saccoglossus kowalevskii]
MTVREYRLMAESDKYRAPKHTDFEDLERKYWKNITYNSPIYGADISGSVTDKDQHVWNINNLNTVLDVVEERQGIKIEGVNTAYLYFGMWKTTFAWHTEDMDLYSINYLHFGEPKSWYTIPPTHGKRLERLASGFFPSSFQQCQNFLRHKMTLISPHILKQYSIPYNKITQEAGEFMITFPYGYHAGYNHGFNCAESTNFASLRWIEFGKRATHTLCRCTRDNVKISMDLFVKEFQPHRYDAWKAGKDLMSIEECLNHVPEKRKRLAAVNATEQTSPDKHQKSTTPRRHGTHSPQSPKKEKRTKLSTPGKRRGRPPKYLKIKELQEKVEREIQKTIPVQGEETKKKSKEEIKEPIVEETEHPVVIATCTAKVKTNTTTTEEAPPLLDKYSIEEPIQMRSEEEIPELDRYPLEETKEPREKKKKSKKKDLSHKNGDSHKKKKRKRSESEKILSVQDLEEIDEIAEKVRDEIEQYDSLSDEPPPLVIVASHQADRVVRLVKEKDHIKSDKKRTVETKEITSDDPSVERVSREEPEKKKKKKRKRKDDTGEHIMHRMATTDDGTSADEAVTKMESDQQRVKSKKNPMFRRHPITKPPQSPLPVSKNDATSEEDISSGSEDNIDGWAKNLNGLWVTQQPDFSSEIDFNATVALEDPHCAICQLFKPKSNQTSITVMTPPLLGQKSTVLVSEMCFASNSSDRAPINTSQLISSDGTSEILVCFTCSVAVHASCYGEFEILDREHWQCRRCARNAWEATCKLCCLRGGALKPTTDNNWVHMVCSIAIPDVSFVNVSHREPVDISRIRPARLRLKCGYCYPIVKQPHIGVCIQCSLGKCVSSFHVTCAYAAGVTMEPDDWPYPVSVICLKHSSSKRREEKRPLPEVKIGQRVIAKHTNRRYYHADVTDTTQQIFYHVDFEDNSRSDDLYPCDIVSHDCEHYGPPPEGSEVAVKWTDGVTYRATFKGYHTVTLYHAVFEDGSLVTLKRELLYTEDEPLPKRVQSKLSTATDMQHDIFYTSPIVEEKHRKVNSRYASLTLRDGSTTDESLTGDYVTMHGDEGGHMYFSHSSALPVDWSMPSGSAYEGDSTMYHQV